MLCLFNHNSIITKTKTTTKTTTKTKSLLFHNLLLLTFTFTLLTPTIIQPIHAAGPETPVDIAYGAWSELGRGIGEENNGDLTGQSVSSSAEGTIVAVGAPYHNSQYGKHAGRVRVYQYDEFNDRWKKIGGDIVGDVGDQSGASVALSITGEFLAVGAPKCSILEENSNGEMKFVKKEVGCVRVYERVADFGVEGSDKWERLGDTIKGENAFDHFGTSVALNDIYTNENNEDLDLLQLAIGAPGAKNEFDEEVGRAYFWQYDVDQQGVDQIWENVSENTSGEDFVGEGTIGSKFGTSVALSIDNDLLLVGAPRTTYSVGGQDPFDIVNSGEVIMFERHLDTVVNRKIWKKVDEIHIYGDDEGDQCGHSVSMNLRGTHIAFGCPYASYYDEDANFFREAGLVEVWKVGRNDQNEWEFINIESTDSLVGEDAGDFFGYSVSLGEDYDRDNENVFLAVGAPNNYPDPNRQRAGHVRVFHLKGDEWYRANLDIDGSDAFDKLGTSVSLSYDGHRVVSGAPGGSGYAKIYELQYTKAPTLAPTAMSTPGDRRKPTSKKPEHGMQDLSYDRKRRSASPFLLAFLFLVLIPALVFLGLKAIMYWRERRQYNSSFGADVRIARPSDLELSQSVVSSSPQPAQPSGTTSPLTRDII